MVGRDPSDVVVLQIKEAQASVLAPYLGTGIATRDGRRIVEGQRVLQASPDVFLGWMAGEGVDGVRRDYYVRQLREVGSPFDIEEMPAPRYFAWAELCGAALARAHARSGDPIAIAAYLGDTDEFDRSMAQFAYAYAYITEHDFATLQHAAEARAVELSAAV
jgi:hypothetical protein